MAYVPGFAHDIFISYSHVDNMTDVPGVEGWVERFHNALEVKLGQRFGRFRQVQIWRDEHLTGDQLFDEVIQNRINTCAIFLALNSYGYKASDYCRQEVDWFYRKAGQEPFGLRVGERIRFFNILLYDISHTEWPEEFGRTAGFPFYDREADEPLPPGSAAFNHQLGELAKAIHQHLTTFRELAEEIRAVPSAVADETAVPSDAEHYDIFLAEVADSLRSTRKRVTSELARQGITVHEKIPPPYPAHEHEQAVRAAMEKSILSVHLLDEWAGAEIEGDETTTYLCKQVAMGMESDRSQLIWVPGHLKLEAIDDEQQKDFLLHLRDQPRTEVGNFLQVLPSEIPQAIMEKLTELKSAAEPTAASGAGVPQAVLLDTHINDQLLAFDISKFLLEKNILPHINPQEDDPRRNVDLLKERLKQVGALVIFYGQVSEEWVRERCKVAMNIIIEEGYPVKAFGIYVAPPGDGKANLSFGPGLVLDNIYGFNPASVLPLLARLGVGS